MLGRIVGAFGVRGWVKVQSFARPPGGILEYRTWYVGGGKVELMEGRLHGNAIVARLQGVEGRDAALAMAGKEVEVARSEMPATEPGEFYWADLVGCVAMHVGGEPLGEVVGLFNNGAQDVLVVRGERERLIPFVQGPIVKAVDLEARTIDVDWDPDF